MERNRWTKKEERVFHDSLCNAKQSKSSFLSELSSWAVRGSMGLVVKAVACKARGPGFNPSFVLSKGIMWSGNKLRNCQSVIVLRQRTQAEFKYLTLAVLPGAIKGLNKNSRGQKLNS